MSTYLRWTKHPKTYHWHHAIWHDDHFGHHHYGVEFNDGTILDPHKYQLETVDREEDIAADEIKDTSVDLYAKTFGIRETPQTFTLSDMHKSMGEAQVDVLNWLIGRCEDQFVRAWIVSERDLVKKLAPISEKGITL